MGWEGVAKKMMVLGGKWNDNKSRLANDKDTEWLALLYGSETISVTVERSSSSHPIVCRPPPHLQSL